MNASTWSHRVQAAYERQDGSTLSALFSPLDALTSQAPLRAELQQGTAPQKVISRLSSQDSASFTKFTVAYLTFLRDVDPSDPDAAWELLDAASPAATDTLKRSSADFFVPVIRRLVQALVELARQADALSPERFDISARNRRTNSTSARLLNLLAACADAEGGPPNGTKQMATLFLANALYRMHFRLRSDIVQLESVNRRVTSMGQPQLKAYSKADQTTYHYYLGRIFLIQRRLTRAMHHLRQAFDLCTDRQPRNRRRILIYLATVSITRGRLPEPALLERYDLSAYFSPLFLPLIKGDMQTCEAILLQPEILATHQQWGTYMLLREKLEVLCWRNLVRRIASLTPRPPEKQPFVIPLAAIAAAARIAFTEDEIDTTDAECIVASLCEQRLVLGYVAHNSAALVIRKTGAFRPPAEVNTEDPAI